MLRPINILSLILNRWAIIHASFILMFFILPSSAFGQAGGILQGVAAITNAASSMIKGGMDSGNRMKQAEIKADSQVAIAQMESEAKIFDIQAEKDVAITKAISQVQIREIEQREKTSLLAMELNALRMTEERKLDLEMKKLALETNYKMTELALDWHEHEAQNELSRIKMQVELLKQGMASALKTEDSSESFQVKKVLLGKNVPVSMKSASLVPKKVRLLSSLNGQVKRKPDLLRARGITMGNSLKQVLHSHAMARGSLPSHVGQRKRVLESDLAKFRRSGLPHAGRSIGYHRNRVPKAQGHAVRPGH